ncbi:MAG: hypothetical protein KGL12_07760 [Rhodospirillales bacterium]|nr:hypothetical protein [Rhodospirillales bacterium]
MRIGGVAGTGRVRAARALTTGGEAADFHMPDAAEAPAAGALAAAGGSVAVLGAMLAAQEWGGPRAPNAAAQRHGRAMLDHLAALQRAMLGGSQDGLGAVLGRLGALAAVEPPPADPALAELLGAIRLRARVELARLGQ